ncbi:MAG TPA: hypothetical protein VHU20_08650 [Candidatus Eisenbacteria bacterium]|nr:hypothetical protein [Candidatus Eisenbacteria bacterium]
MEKRERRWSVERVVVLAAIAAGVIAGTYGIANAASGSSSGSGQAPAAAPSAQRHWGPQRSDETPLTGDALSKVSAAAKAKVPGGTIIRVETDADGNSAYEAHMVRADGTPVTVYVNKQFDVVSVESGMPGRPGRTPQSSSAASA